jgi:hypothetical protein
MHLHLIIIGIALIVLALIHFIFPKYFNWEKELATLSLINKQMTIIHTFFIALAVFLMGILCLSSTDELIRSHLGHQVCLGFAIFWTCRLVIQFFGYSSLLWKGKTFETIIHILFSFLWIYISTIFWLIYFG